MSMLDGDTRGEIESLLKRADECALLAKLASDPAVRAANARLAEHYRERAARLTDRSPPCGT